jgi:hypothetical protein
LPELVVPERLERVGHKAIVRMKCGRPHLIPYVASTVMWRQGADACHCMHAICLDAT